MQQLEEREAEDRRAPRDRAARTAARSHAATMRSKAACQRKVPVAISPASARSRSSSSLDRTRASACGRSVPSRADQPQDVVGGDARRGNHAGAIDAPAATRRPARNSRAVITRRPSGWSSRIRTTSPSPATTSRSSPRRRERPCRPADSTSRSVSCGPVNAARDDPPDAPRRSGQGCRPRTRLWICAAGSRPGHGALGLRRSSAAYVTPCGWLRRLDRAAVRELRRRVSDSSRRRAPRGLAPPPRWSRPGRSVAGDVANIAPASSSLTTRMIVTPVSVSPAMTARWTGAAPRHRGSIEPCTLIMPEPRDREQRVRQDPPVGCDHAEVRLASRALLAGRPRRAASSGCSTGMPCASATAFVGCRDEVLPASLRPIRLRHDARPRRAGSASRRCERRHGERRRAEVDDAQAGERHHLPARFSFWILRTIMSRLIPRRRSMNTMPSR